MKAIYRIIIAIFAAAALAVSCSKDAVPDDGAQTVTGAPRVITLSYGSSTKAALDGFTPKFSDGDRIMLSNGTRTEECTVSVDDGKATVTTTLSGVLNAVSPASAAVTGGGELTYKIPVTQSGRFSDAAIATAHNIISAAELEIQVSLLKFYVDESISVHSITVESTQNIATDGTNLKQITVGTGSGFLHEIAEDTQRRLCYAAVLPGVPASSLKFTSDTDTQGTVIRQSPASTVTLAKNTLYKAFIPYYIKIKVSSAPDVYQRWGYCNVGAFLPEEYGDYFMWGGTVGYKYNGSKWVKAADNSDMPSGGFVITNAPYNNGTSYNKYTGTSGDGKTVLDFADDVAYANWGGTWRLPTKEELEALLHLSEPAWDGTPKGYNFGTDDAKIFLPAAGYGDGMVHGLVDRGGYWSSLLNTNNTTEAYLLGFGVDDVAMFNRLRYYGQSIRPIYDNTWTMEDYDDGGDI